MVRCLGSEDLLVELVVVGGTSGCAAKSKYVNHIWRLDNINDIIPFFVNYCKNEVGEVVVISCDDATTTILDEHANELVDNCACFHTNRQGDLSYYMNKLNQVGLAKQIGYNVPESVIYGEDSFKDFYHYPCIIKPLESIHGGKKIEICKNEIELKDCISDFSLGDMILIQQYVKRDKELVVLGMSSNYETTISACIEKIRDNKGGTTYSKVCGIESLPTEIVNYSEEIIKRIGYYGLFGIELIKSGDIFFFIEINLRNDATCYSLAKAGLNLPIKWVMDSVGSEIPNSHELVIREIYSMVELKDFKSMLKGEVSLRKWLQQLCSSECLYYFDSQDIKPFFYAVLEIFSRPFRRKVIKQ